MLMLMSSKYPRWGHPRQCSLVLLRSSTAATTATAALEPLFCLVATRCHTPSATRDLHQPTLEALKLVGALSHRKYCAYRLVGSSTDISRRQSIVMLDYTQLQQVFPAGLHSPYDRKLQQDIDAHRKTLSGVLFIDRVLRALGIAKRLSSPQALPSQIKTNIPAYSQGLPSQDGQCAQAVPPGRLRGANVHTSQALPLLLRPSRL